MARQRNVQIIEKNEGTKIELTQNNYKLTFGDDDLSFRCDTAQREYPVHRDICYDDDGSLINALGRYYVAQVDIPPIEYTETEQDGETVREAVPLDMADVIVTLWSIDDMTPTN